MFMHVPNHVQRALCSNTLSNLRSAIIPPTRYLQSSLARCLAWFEDSVEEFDRINKSLWIVDRSEVLGTMKFSNNFDKLRSPSLNHFLLLKKKRVTRKANVALAATAFRHQSSKFRRKIFFDFHRPFNADLPSDISCIAKLVFFTRSAYRFRWL